MAGSEPPVGQIWFVGLASAVVVALRVHSYSRDSGQHHRLGGPGGCSNRDKTCAPRFFLPAVPFARIDLFFSSPVLTRVIKLEMFWVLSI